MSSDPSYSWAEVGDEMPGVWFTSSLASSGNTVLSVPAPRIESVLFAAALELDAEPRYSYPAKNPAPPTAAATTMIATIQTVVEVPIGGGAGFVELSVEVVELATDVGNSHIA